jgi:hypothetical protein
VPRPSVSGAVRYGRVREGHGGGAAGERGTTGRGRNGRRSAGGSYAAGTSDDEAEKVGAVRPSGRTVGLAEWEPCRRVDLVEGGGNKLIFF